MSSDLVIANTDPMFDTKEGHTTFMEPYDVQTFNTSTTAVPYNNMYARSTLSLIDGNTAVKISAVETKTNGSPYGLNIETSARFRAQNGETPSSLQYIEGNVTLHADTIIKGNLLVQDFTYPETVNRSTSVRGHTKYVGISTSNFHTESEFVETKVITNSSGLIPTLTSAGSSSDSRTLDSNLTYCSKVHIDDQGVRIGDVLNAGNLSNRLVLDRVYVPNDLRLGDTREYNAGAGFQAYAGVATCVDVTESTSLFTTKSVSPSTGRVALNSDKVDLVFNTTDIAQTITTTNSIEQDSTTYVFPRTALLKDVVNNVAFLTDGPMADEVKRRIGTLDSSIQSTDLQDLQTTDEKFKNYVSSPLGGVFNLRDTAGILKALNLKVDAIGQGLTPELLNTILDIANRLQGSEQYNIMAELSLLQRSIGYVTNRLDSLTTENFDVKDNVADVLLTIDSNNAFVYYRPAIFRRLSDDTKTYSAISAGIYYKYTGYNLAVGGVRSSIPLTQVYYYNPLRGQGFFFDSILNKWAYVEGVCLYTSEEGLLLKEDKTLYDDYVPKERYISTVFTGTSNSLWSFGSDKNYEDSYYGSMTSDLSLYEEKTESKIPGLSDASSVITMLETKIGDMTSNADTSGFWNGLSDNQKLAFSGKNFSDKGLAVIRNDMKALGVSFGTLSDDNVTNFFRKDFSDDTAHYAIKTSVTPYITGRNVVYPSSTVLNNTGVPLSDLWYSTLAGRRVFNQCRYRFVSDSEVYDGRPVFGFGASLDEDTNTLKLTYSPNFTNADLDDLKKYILVNSDGSEIICYIAFYNSWYRIAFTPIGTPVVNVPLQVQKSLFHMSIQESGSNRNFVFAYASALTTSLENISTENTLWGRDLHVDFSQQSVLLREVVTMEIS
jgi:hypothetical protein